MYSFFQNPIICYDSSFCGYFQANLLKKCKKKKEVSEKEAD